MPYQYVRSVNRYRDTSTGRFVTREEVMSYVDTIISTGEDEAATLARLVSSGELSPADFGLQLREEIKAAHIQEYILGRGGRSQMTARDWGTVGRMLREQYTYVDGFVEDISAGGLSEGQIRVRAGLYFKTARQAYERGNAAAYGLPKLPAYPADGSSECVSGCQCYWRFVKLPGDGNVDCFWETDPIVENCDTCIARGGIWYPLQVRGGKLLPYQDVRAEAHHHHEEHHHV